MLTKSRTNFCHLHLFSFKDLPNGKREFLGSVFVTFGSKSDANDFFKDQRLNRLTFKGRKLKAKWQRDFLNDRAEFNDELDEAALDRTIYVSGFDKLVVAVNHANCLQSA